VNNKKAYMMHIYQVPFSSGMEFGYAFDIYEADDNVNFVVDYYSAPKELIYKSEVIYPTYEDAQNAASSYAVNYAKTKKGNLND
jgi:hypothetical protein